VSDPTLAQNELARILVPALSGLVGALIGVIAGHLLTARRDREQKRREFAIKYLVEAWQNLELTSRQIDIVRKSQAMEKAIADIQLFGSPEQISLAQKFTQEMSAKGSSDATVLLQELQVSLRKELGLKKPPTKIFFLRVTPLLPDDLKRYNER
jgi:hypothetical protein